MDESGLFQIDRFRVPSEYPTDGDGGPVAKKSKLSSVLAKARKRAEKRKNEDTETPEEVDEESSSSSEEEVVEEMDVDEKSSVSEMQVDEDFKILENVAENKREKINMALPKWCQSPTLIQPKLENLEKLKKIKPLVRPEIYKNLKEMGFKNLFPVQSVLTTKLLERGPKRDFAVQGRGSPDDMFVFVYDNFSTNWIGKNSGIFDTNGSIGAQQNNTLYAWNGCCTDACSCRTNL